MGGSLPRAGAGIPDPPGRAGHRAGAAVATHLSQAQSQAADQVHGPPQRDADQLLQIGEQRGMSPEDDGRSPGHGLPSAPTSLVVEWRATVQRTDSQGLRQVEETRTCTARSSSIIHVSKA